MTSTGSSEQGPARRPKRCAYKWVHRVRGRDGKLRFYLRRRGFARVRLKGEFGSTEWAENYRQAMDGAIALPPREIGASRTLAGSINALIASYLASTQWTEGLAKNSKHTRRPILEKLRTSEKWGNVLVRDLKAKHVRAILDVQKGHAKRHWCNTLRGLFRFAIDTEVIEDDPSAGIKVTQPRSDGFHAWDDGEIGRYRAYWPLGSEARLVFEFALETASRRCEIVRLGLQHVRKGRIQIERAKGSDAVDIEVSPELQAALDAMPDNGNLTYLLNAKGQPYTPDQLGRKFKEWADAAGMPKQCRLHGLKKSRASQIASKGGSAHQIMAITGHRSLAQAQKYADKFNKREAADAAMALLKTTASKAPGGIALDDVMKLLTQLKADQKANVECKTA